MDVLRKNKDGYDNNDYPLICLTQLVQSLIDDNEPVKECNFIIRGSKDCMKKANIEIEIVYHIGEVEKNKFENCHEAIEFLDNYFRI